MYMRKIHKKAFSASPLSRQSASVEHRALQIVKRSLPPACSSFERLFLFENLRKSRNVEASPQKQIEQRMKKISAIIALAGLLAIPAFAADKEVTVTGLGQCAKCALHETKECQNTITTEEHGKKVTYYLAENDKSKDFHDNICKKSEKITATGVLSEKDGKKVLTVSKIEAVKEK